MRDKPAYLAIAGVCTLLAFGLTVQLKSVKVNAQTDNTITARAEQLQIQLATERQKNESLYTQIIQYKDQLQQFSREAEEQGGYAKILGTQLEQASILAGDSAVQGPGVTVTMQDSTRPNTGNENENFFVIHDEDLLRVVNELRDSGAEALSLNGERLLATSEIRCAGSTVSVNNNRYAAPYVIKAIGNAEEMEKALNMRQGVVEVLGEWGIKIEVKRESSMVIEGYAGSRELKFAKPVNTAGK